MLRQERRGQTDPQQQSQTSQLMALFDQGTCQRQGFSCCLAPQHSVTRTQPRTEVGCTGVVRLHAWTLGRAGQDALVNQSTHLAGREAQNAGQNFLGVLTQLRRRAGRKSIKGRKAHG